MNLSQIRMYRAEWARVKKALAPVGYSEAELEAERARIHAECGAPGASSKDLTAPQFTRVLGEFWKYSKRDDMNAQMRQMKQTREARIIWCIDEMAKEMGLGRAYVDGLVARAGAGGKLRVLPLEKMEFEELQKVAAIMKKTARARRRAGGES